MEKTKTTLKRGKVKIFSFGAGKPLLNGETETTFKRIILGFHFAHTYIFVLMSRVEKMKYFLLSFLSSFIEIASVLNNM